MSVASNIQIRELVAGSLLVALINASTPGALLAAEPEKPRVAEGHAPDFETDVAPIFQTKCLKCHGEKDRKAELDLRTLATLLKGGESGAVIVPKDPDQSLLYEK